MVIIEVADNGPGILTADKPRIFDPYFTRSEAGSGLGLAVVASTIAEHQGFVRVFDNQPRGAKFVIELPIRQTQKTQRRTTS